MVDSKLRCMGCKQSPVKLIVMPVPIRTFQDEFYCFSCYVYLTQSMVKEKDISLMDELAKHLKKLEEFYKQLTVLEGEVKLIWTDNPQYQHRQNEKISPIYQKYKITFKNDRK